MRPLLALALALAGVSGCTLELVDQGPAPDARPSCGDAVLDPGERCDDGNTVGGDGCAALCDSDEQCGNAILDVARGEVCDDGNTVNGDGCSADCRALGACGNAVVDPGEQCDAGGAATASCDADCTAAACGDGLLNVPAGEACDDGNNLDGDGCRANCTLP